MGIDPQIIQHSYFDIKARQLSDPGRIIIKRRGIVGCGGKGVTAADGCGILIGYAQADATNVGLKQPEREEDAGEKWSEKVHGILFNL